MALTTNPVTGNPIPGDTKSRVEIWIDVAGNRTAELVRITEEKSKSIGILDAMIPDSAFDASYPKEYEVYDLIESPISPAR